MTIGIDISQLAYPQSGVSNYLENLVENLSKIDNKNKYILFYSSLRRRLQISNFEFLNKSKYPNIKLKTFRLPLSLLDLLWNRLHIFSIENLIGNIDVFITSDWLEPPVRKAKKATILYDLIVYKYPEETDRKIVDTQRRKLKIVKKEANIVFCISESTKKDAEDILGIDKKKLFVINPGI